MVYSTYFICPAPQVLVLLDVTPDQSMVDEGVAREVINRIQKLRKKVSKSKKERENIFNVIFLSQTFV